ncbi:MAG: ABC transporter ATP-binding protein [Mesorhizobium sp.]|uniref:ABC transporter ATP-binding protein n=1 Tax=Mesorhizobium sp. TaxID=1871066 RepID=UPI000FE9DF5B|nr:ABC transporter ATP-binding protein [Mesorhizobium sp.]RWI48932.1 MAG: ABC transporter ATP-binding protein [Mesorhizobium sp.]
MTQTAAATPLLSCQRVRKSFGALTAVRDLSFDVGVGEILGIGGPNGAGKTTLFEVISGLGAVSAGTISLDGQVITGLAPQQICHAGVARTFQLNAGFDSMTARQNVLVGAYFGQKNRAVPTLRAGRAANEATDAALEMLGIADKANVVTGLLPVLDRKLLMMASAMATKPKLLLMDEPVGGLTSGEIDRVMEAVRTTKRAGVTIILIEHVMRFLVRLSDRVMIMHHGEKIFEGAPHELVNDRTVVEVYLGKGASEHLKTFMDAAHG